MADLVDTPQFKIPFNVVGTKVPVIEQDSPEDVEQNAIVVMRYTKGERLGLPEFGIPDQAFREGGLVADELISSVQRWEPEATVSVVKGVIDNGMETDLVSINPTNKA